MVEKSINHDVNPLNDIMRKSNRLKKTVEQNSKKSMLKESNSNSQSGASGIGENQLATLMITMINEVRELSEKLSNIEGVLSESKIVDDSDKSKVKLLINGTLLEGKMNILK